MTWRCLSKLWISSALPMKSAWRHSRCRNLTTHCKALNALVFTRWSWFDWGRCSLTLEYLVIALEDGEAYQGCVRSRVSRNLANLRHSALISRWHNFQDFADLTRCNNSGRLTTVSVACYWEFWGIIRLWLQAIRLDCGWLVSLRVTCYAA